MYSGYTEEQARLADLMERAAAARAESETHPSFMTADLISGRTPPRDSPSPEETYVGAMESPTDLSSPDNLDRYLKQYRLELAKAEANLAATGIPPSISEITEDIGSYTDEERTRAYAVADSVSPGNRALRRQLLRHIDDLNAGISRIETYATDRGTWDAYKEIRGPAYAGETAPVRDPGALREAMSLREEPVAASELARMRQLVGLDAGEEQ